MKVTPEYSAGVQYANDVRSYAIKYGKAFYNRVSTGALVYSVRTQVMEHGVMLASPVALAHLPTKRQRESFITGYRAKVKELYGNVTF